jgi:hypothetical protein
MSARCLRAHATRKPVASRERTKLQQTVHSPWEERRDRQSNPTSGHHSRFRRRRHLDQLVPRLPPASLAKHPNASSAYTRTGRRPAATGGRARASIARPTHGAPPPPRPTRAQGPAASTLGSAWARIQGCLATSSSRMRAETSFTRSWGGGGCWRGVCGVGGLGGQVRVRWGGRGGVLKGAGMLKTNHPTATTASTITPPQQHPTRHSPP